MSEWIGPADPSRPASLVPIPTFKDDSGEFTQQVADFCAAIAESCAGESLDLDTYLHEVPDRVRPIIRGPQLHPIGKGPGARLMPRLAEHIDAHCPDLEPLAWAKAVRLRLPAPRCQSLDQLPLKNAQQNRSRMLCC
jgi:hypothetical protein